MTICQHLHNTKRTLTSLTHFLTHTIHQTILETRLARTIGTLKD